MRVLRNKPYILKLWDGDEPPTEDIQVTAASHGFVRDDGGTLEVSYVSEQEVSLHTSVDCEPPKILVSECYDCQKLAITNETTQEEHTQKLLDAGWVKHLRWWCPDCKE